MPSKKMWLMVEHFFIAYFDCYILVATGWQPDHGQEVTVQNSPPMTSFLAVKNNNYKQSYYCWKSNYLKWKYSNGQKNLQGLLRVVWGLLRVLRVVQGLLRIVGSCHSIPATGHNWLQLVDIGWTVGAVDISQVAGWAKNKKKKLVKLQLSTKKVLQPDPTLEHYQQP